MIVFCSALQRNKLQHSPLTSQVSLITQVQQADWHSDQYRLLFIVLLQIEVLFKLDNAKKCMGDQ